MTFEASHSFLVSPMLQELARNFSLDELANRELIHDHWVTEQKLEILSAPLLQLDGYCMNVTLASDIHVDEQNYRESIAPWTIEDLHINANSYLDDHLSLALKNGEKALAECFGVLPHTMKTCGPSFSHIPAEKCLWKFYLLKAHCSKPIGSFQAVVDLRYDAPLSSRPIWEMTDGLSPINPVEEWSSAPDSTLMSLFISLAILILIGFVRFQRAR